MEAPSVHASCVSIGGQGVLIRGPSGSGKSHLSFALILAGGAGLVPPVHLVADDRVHLSARGGEVRAAAPQALAGLIEIRGVGPRRLPHLADVPVRLVVDLQADDAARLPSREACRCVLCGIEVARLPILAGGDPVQQVLACLVTGDPAG